MNALEGRTAIITGAGRGIGREHALLFAAEGANVVVNDLGTRTNGAGSDASAAQNVVEEIVALGGRAVANYDDVTDWESARRLVETAIETFGDVHVLVNNAGILRDRMLVNMTEDDWDAVVRVHLKGHFCPTRHVASYWRDRWKAGDEQPRSIVNTTSTSGLFGNVGQANYGAAKIGIAGLTMIAAEEFSRFGVRVNAIAPAAHTRMTAGIGDIELGEGPDDLHPANVSPFVAYLATEKCPHNGRIFFVHGGQVHLFRPHSLVDKIEKRGRWTVEELEVAAARLAEIQFDLGNPFANPG